MLLLASGWSDLCLVRIGPLDSLVEAAGVSESGGDGGVGISELAELFDLLGGGVETVGDESVVPDTWECVESGRAGRA